MEVSQERIVTKFCDGSKNLSLSLARSRPAGDRSVVQRDRSHAVVTGRRTLFAWQNAAHSTTHRAAGRQLRKPGRPNAPVDESAAIARTSHGGCPVYSRC